LSSANDGYINQLKAEIAREQEFRKAVVEEFKESINSDKEFSPEDMKKRFFALLPTAFERLTFLINGAESEAVQLSAIKYVFNIATGQIAITNTNDPDAKLAELLSSLVKSKS
jgi:hypothetical protein